MAPRPPALGPLRNSFVVDEVEGELRDLFVSLFDTYLSADRNDENVLGMAHLGSAGLIEGWMHVDGLSLPNQGDANAYEYLYRAWKGRNSGRGLHFLRTCLQLIWPNGWELNQLWQSTTDPYPTNLLPAPAGTLNVPGYFLTSRIQVGIEDLSETGAQAKSVIPMLRSVIAARLVLDVVLLRLMQSTLEFSGAIAGTAVMVADFDCAPGMPESTSGLAAATVAKTVMMIDFNASP